jgi:hypothetical protein
MKEEKKNPLKLLSKRMKNPNPVLLKTELDLELNRFSVQFSVLCQENEIDEKSKEIHYKSRRDVLTSGFSKNEIEHLKRLYVSYQIEKGICGSSHWP